MTSGRLVPPSLIPKVIQSTEGGGQGCRCGWHSQVIDSRPTLDGAIRRRRKCQKCNARWTTYERNEDCPIPPNGTLALLQARITVMRESLDALERIVAVAANTTAMLK